MKRLLLSVIQISMVSAFLAGCLPRTISEMFNLGNNLTIKGRIVDASGQSLADTLIFVERDTDSSASTDSNGQFEIKLTEDRLVRLKGQVDPTRAVFYLYAEKGISSNKTVGMSELIELSARGSRSVRDITLKSGATVKGVIQALPQGRSLGAAEGATVRVGRSTTTVATDGSFELKDVPEGKLVLTASAPELANTRDNIVTVAGDTYTLTRPLVLYSERGISGSLIPVPTVVTADMIQQGHPFVRYFFASGSADVRYVRYNSNLDLLKKSSPWIPMKDKLEYDFPGTGGYTLYYQFADETRQRLSDVYQSTLSLDVFEDSKGITINDGSGVSASSLVTVNIDVPLAAYRMRISDNIDTLLNKPWQRPSDKKFVQFDPIRVESGQVLERFQMRGVYVQFTTATGLESIVFSAAVKLDLMNDGIVNLGQPGGSGVFFRRKVPVYIERVPTNAMQVRVADDLQTVSDQPWIDVGHVPANSPVIVDHVLFLENDLTNLPGIIYKYARGNRTINVQFRDAAGFVSSTYQQQIFIDLFPYLNGYSSNPAAQVVNIAPCSTSYSGCPGSPYSSVLVDSRRVTIQINPEIFQPNTSTNLFPDVPMYARLYELSLNNFDLNLNLDIRDFLIQETDTRRTTNLAIDPLTQTLDYVFLTGGPKILYLQFIDPNGVISGAVQIPVDIEVFPGNDYGFDFGPLSTTNPNLLNIILHPPINATKYRIWEGNFDGDVANAPWQSFPDPNVQFLSSTGSGPKVINVQYLSEGFSLSGVVRKTIIVP